MKNPSEWKLGRHAFRWDAPDGFWVRIEGDNSLEESRQMVNLYRALGERGPFFVVADMRAAGVLESEARRCLSENLRSEWFQGVIFYNTRLLHRSLAQGLILAAEPFHAMPEASLIRQRLHFVSTQVQAQALLAQLRGQDDAPCARD